MKIKAMRLAIIGAVGLLGGCAGWSPYPVETETYTAAAYERVTYADGRVDITSATLAVTHAGILNGDSVTTGTARAGRASAGGGARRGYASAVSWWQITAGALAGYLAHGGIAP